jgi:dolichol-phosphate mannosyltransferase
VNKLKCLVILPTYNEEGNVEAMIREVLRADEGITVVVVDDNSSDGTSEKVMAIKERDARVDLIRRYGKRGRGLAEEEALRYAVRRDPDCIIEMDADFSHDPKYIPVMLDAIREYDVVIGSRFVPGGVDERKSVVRKCITKTARIFINVLLGLNISDPTSGFRCFRTAVIKAIEPGDLRAETPFVLLEMLYKISRTGASIKEIPIHFHPRNEDKSKLTVGILMNCFFNVILLRIRGR